MKTLRIAALAVAVSGVFTLGAKAGTDTNNWWDVDFEALSEFVPDDPAQAMVVLTNQYSQDPPVTPPWTTGNWFTQDGDETTVTNEFGGKASTILKLDTQGNDLTWRVDATNTMPDSRTALVDADLYLVGSDSPPDTGDFDAGDVQTAVYLKNETDEDSGETTNSVLCVYVRNAGGQNYWQELKGVTWVRELPEGGTETLDGLKDNDWASVKVVVDHAKVINPQNPFPVVQVFVNGVKMTARDGDADHWTAANPGKAQEQGRVSSVAFRGTGAVDNFVGKLVETTFDKYDFTAEVYMNGTLVAQGTEGNVTRVEEDVEAGAGKVAKFEDFMYHDFVDVDNPASYSLTKIDLVSFATGSGVTTTYNFGYEKSTAQIVPPANLPGSIQFMTDVDEEENTFFTGVFHINAPTEGATQDGTIVKLYFEDLPAEGQFKLTASQNVGNAPADQIFNVNDENLPAFATFTFAESISAGGTSYILSKIKPGTAPADPITLEYESPNAVVKVPLSDEITGTQYEVATATYVEGTLGDRVLGYEWDATNGEWSFTAKDKPVAIIVAGNVTNEYSSLRAAIEVASAGDTITLVADDSVSFTAENPILDIEIAVTIDGGSNTLYGISDFAGEGYNEVRIGGSGNVTIKDLAFSEFGDTAPLSGASMPICTRSSYTGKLVLDGVTIDKFNRQALLLCGGKFLITNSVITGCAGEEGKTSYFQSAIETYYAKGDVGDTTITGIGALNAGGPTPDDEWAAAVFTVNPLAGADGSIKVTGGYYEGQFIVAFNPETTGTVTLEGGTFVATAAVTESAFLDDSEGGSTLTISGGWFDREPEANYIAEGLAARQIGTDPAPWTVGQSFTITFNNDDGTEFYKTNGVFTGETGYGPATDPTKGETFTFVGWTNLVAGGAAVATADLPAANGDATWTAVFKEDSVIDPIAVDPGTSLTTADKENGDLPIEVTAAGFVVKFRSSQPGIVYQLVAAGTCDLTEDQWKGVAASGNAVPVEGASKTSSATTSETNTELITLTAPMTDNVKFFKIRASLPDGN